MKAILAEILVTALDQWANLKALARKILRK